MGTKEWASSNVNIISGCSHNCRYCYSKKIAIRFNRKTEDTWKIMELNKKKLNHNYGKRNGRVIFPSSHDIVPEFKEECFEVIEKLLEANNSVLITTKPHFEVIRDLCFLFVKYRDLIQFRFTITSLDNELLKFWEPGAPLFEERLTSLVFANSMNYKTSVSIEPFLDKNPISLVKKIYPFISETIWIGKMNYIKQNHISSNERNFYEKIRENYRLENLQNIVNNLYTLRKIRYKDSIRKYNLNFPPYQMPNLMHPEINRR